LFDACKRLALAAIFAFAVGMAYVIYMLTSRHSSFDQILAFAMTMSNTYGVLLITVLMGSGLAGVPKRLWAMSNIDDELTRLYLSAPHIEDSYQEARYELEDCEIEIKRAIEVNEKLAGHNLNKDLIIILKEKFENFNFANKSSTRAFMKTSPNDHRNKDYTEKEELVKLHGRLMSCQLRARASERRWRVLISQCKQYQVRNPRLSFLLSFTYFVIFFSRSFLIVLNS
jgi:hypothetical protein